MAKKIFLAVALLGLYLGLAYLLQPKLRQVLRAPATENSKAESGEPVAYECEKGQTAFALLLNKLGGKVSVKEYSFGKMVEEIDGVKGGTDGKFWIYFVAGKSATVSADSYRCLDKEKVEWKLIKPE